MKNRFLADVLRELSEIGLGIEKKYEKDVELIAASEWGAYLYQCKKCPSDNCDGFLRYVAVSDAAYNCEGFLRAQTIYPDED